MFQKQHDGTPDAPRDRLSRAHITNLGARAERTLDVVVPTGEVDPSRATQTTETNEPEPDVRQPERDTGDDDPDGHTQPGDARRLRGNVHRRHQHERSRR